MDSQTPVCSPLLKLGWLKSNALPQTEARGVQARGSSAPQQCSGAALCVATASLEWRDINSQRGYVRAARAVTRAASLLALAASCMLLVSLYLDICFFK